MAYGCRKRHDRDRSFERNTVRGPTLKKKTVGLSELPARQGGIILGDNKHRNRCRKNFKCHIHCHGRQRWPRHSSGG
jgi:hypothetical protein